jgi:hypothetical protein
LKQPSNSHDMNAHSETAKLLEEIGRYLAAVDLFRAAGCEPTWRPERPAGVSRALAASVPLRTPSDVELH